MAKSAPSPADVAAGNRAALGCFLFVLAFFGWCYFTPSAEERVAKEKAARIATMKAPPHSVDYRIVEQWTIPNGGYGRAIVIAPSATDERSLRALEAQLKYDTREDRNAFVFIYSDPRAAALRHSAISGTLSKADETFFDDHFVATYFRNINTGLNALEIFRSRPTGPLKSKPLAVPNPPSGEYRETDKRAEALDLSATFFEFQVEKPVVRASGTASPHYPDILKSAGVEGEVLAQFVVDTTGHVDPATLKILKTSHELFALAVRNALPSMRFLPAEIAGKKVRQLVQEPFVFSIQK